MVYGLWRRVRASSRVKVKVRVRVRARGFHL
jgi:hypothetical protein